MVVYYKVFGQSVGSHWVRLPTSSMPDPPSTDSLLPRHGWIIEGPLADKHAFQLSIATLSTLFVGSWAMTGGKKADAQKGPPINAKSKDEEDFVTYVRTLPISQETGQTSMPAEARTVF